MFSNMRARCLFFCVIIPCALQQPRVIMDLTEDIELFQRTKNSKARKNIEMALSYSPNFQYRTNEPLENTRKTVQWLSMLVFTVCLEGKLVVCDINQTNLYLYYIGSATVGDVETRRSHLSNLSSTDEFHPQFRSLEYISNGNTVWNLDARKAKLYEDIDEEYLKTGLLMDKALYEKFERLGPTFLYQSANQVIRRLFVSVSFTYPQGLPESFTLFQSSFSGVFNFLQRVKAVFQGEPKTKFHLAISFNYSPKYNSMGGNAEQEQRSIKTQYQTLILRFVNQLAKKANIDVLISGVFIPANFTRSDFVSPVVVGQNVHPITHFEPCFFFPATKPFCLDFFKYLTIDGEFAPAFKTLLMTGAKNVLVYLEKETKQKQTAGASKPTTVWIRDIFGIRSDKQFEVWSKLLQSNQSLPRKFGMELETVLLDKTQVDSKDFHFPVNRILKLISDSQLKLGYYIDLAPGSNDTSKYFHSFSDSKFFHTILVRFKIYVPPLADITTNYYVDSIQTPLATILETWKVLQSSLSKTQTLVIELTLVWDEVSDSSVCDYKAYCDSCMSTMNSAIEAILVWGKIHQVTIAIYTLIDVRGHGSGWYSSISKDYDVFLPRSQPIQLLNHENACIDQTLSVPSDGIQLSPSFSGITVNLSLANTQGLSGGLDEMKIMMQFALNRFKLLEILLVHDNQCTAASTLDKLLKSGIFDTKSQVRLFLDFHLQSIDNVSMSAQVECIEKLSETVANSVDVNLLEAGIHLSYLETINNMSTMFSRINQTKHSKVYIGLFIKDCERLRKSQYTTCRFPLTSVDYILCQTEFMEASNKNLKNMSQHLDSNLYLVKKFQIICPKLQVYYRLTSYSQSIQIGPSSLFKLNGVFVWHD